MTRPILEFVWRRLHAALVWIVLLPVTLYRAVSPMKRAPTCRFLPTCSEYALTAVRERGIVIGGALATWRVLRCNPLCRGGYDPVRRGKLAPLQSGPVPCTHCEELDARPR